MNVIFSVSYDQVVLPQNSYDQFMVKNGPASQLKESRLSGHSRFEVLINDDVKIKQIEKIKYLGVRIMKKALEKRR